MIKNGSLNDVIESWYYNREDYTTTPNGSLFRKGGVLYSYGEHFPLAVHLGRYQLINADRYSNSTGKHQSYTIRTCGNPCEIPFSALSSVINDKEYMIRDGYNFNAENLKDHMIILDHESDKYIHTGRFSKVDGHEYLIHVLGTTVFSYDDRYFISGIDETGKGNSKYYMTELLEPVETVEGALEAMKAPEVVLAEQKGETVLRQGEWFFLPTTENFKEIVKDLPIEKNGHLEYRNEFGHHTASEVARSGRFQYCRGIVKHDNGDHKQLKLYDNVKDKQWYLAVHNLQRQSFNAVGNVD